jgi:micrococcal nuclease
VPERRERPGAGHLGTVPVTPTWHARAVRRALSLILVLLAVGGGVAACSADDAPASNHPASDPPRPTTAFGRATAVERIVDGDTIVVAGDETVRLIGIDTPETKDPRRPVQCFGAEATRRITELIPAGEAVVLVRDVSDADRYGRTLAYVYRERDRLFVNAAMVRDGYAAASTYPPDVEHADEFRTLERSARESGRGLWSACGGPDVPA